MKIAKVFLVVMVIASMLIACDSKNTIETNVNEDGSIDKTITVLQLHKKDLAKPFGISESTGWTKISTEVHNDTLLESTSDLKYQHVYSKVFASVDEMNKEMAVYRDTALQTEAIFEKKFRWFYTYIYYAEKYYPINKFRLPIDGYITAEDAAFIDRLPAEGKKISKADSIQLTAMSDKLYETYATAAIVEEYSQILTELIRSQKIEDRWLDTLRTHKKEIFAKIINEQDIKNDFLLSMLDSIGVPLDYTVAQKEFDQKSKAFESKLSFMTYANEGKFDIVINMPWDVIHTNADSISGGKVFWKPSMMKFLFKEHTFYAESRKLNYWAVAISAVIIGFTVFLFVKRKRDSNSNA